jgi:hypothetical protein
MVKKLLLLLSLIFLCAARPAHAAYSFNQAVTIDHTKVGSSDSTNFPFLFSGTYTYLKTAFGYRPPPLASALIQKILKGGRGVKISKVEPFADPLRGRARISAKLEFPVFSLYSRWSAKN